MLASNYVININVPVLKPLIKHYATEEWMYRPTSAQVRGEWSALWSTTLLLEKQAPWTGSGMSPRTHLRGQQKDFAPTGTQTVTAQPSSP